MLTTSIAGVVAYPAPFSSILTSCISIAAPEPVVNTVAFAGITGSSIVSVGLPTQKPPERVTPLTTPLDTLAVAVGLVLHIAVVAVTVTSGTPKYPDHLSVMVTVVAALSLTTAFATTFGAAIVMIGAELHVPPDSVISVTTPFSIVAIPVGNVVHLPFPLTVTVGGAIYHDPPEVISTLFPLPFAVAVAGVRVVVR